MQTVKKMNNKIAFRANASSSIGSGHIRRVSLLSRVLRARGFKTLLLCNPDALDVVPGCAEAYDKVHVTESEANCIAWLKTTIGERLAGIVFDCYSLDAQQHRQYKSVAKVLAGIDDTATRKLGFSLVFNLNLGSAAQDYVGLVSQSSVICAGPKYQILAPRFFDMRPACLEARWARINTCHKALICMGGTDPLALTPRALETVLKTLTDIQVEVVIGSAAACLPQVLDIAKKNVERVKVHVDAKHMPDLMCEADIAVGAGGTMTWERNCLGLPSIMLIMVENQEKAGRAMQQHQAAYVIDAQAGYPDAEVARGLDFLAKSSENRLEMSKFSASLGGNNGAVEIANVLENAITQSTSH